MGSSGLLLVGVVALWLFGAMPHWVRRSEALAAEHVASDPVAQRTVPVRRRADAADFTGATTSGGILGRPRRDDGPRRAAAGTVRTVERPQASPNRPREALRETRAVQSGPPVSRTPLAARQRRPRRTLVPLALVAALVAVPVLLAAGGASVTTVALTALALAVLGVAVLRVRARRAAVRRRALARRRAARPWLVSSSGPAVHRPAVRRSGADEASADRRHAVGA